MTACVKDFIFKVAVTSRCNFRCTYCRPCNSSNEMSDKALKRVLKSAAEVGLQKLNWTGGEPTIRPNIIEIVKYAQSLGFLSQSMTTNGSILYRMAKRLHNAGLYRIVVSIDTLNHKKFHEITGVNKLHAVKKSIMTALEYFDNVGMNVVVDRNNQNTVGEIIEFAQECKGGEKLRIKFLEMVSQNNSFLKNFGSSDITYENRFVPAKEIIKYMSENGELIGGIVGPENSEIRYITYRYKIAGKNGDYLESVYRVNIL